MKRVLFFLFSFFLSLAFVLPSSAQAPRRCFVGFTYQISYQKGWGASRAVVLSVHPLGPASRAGLRVGDIIEEVQGRSVEELDEEQLSVGLLTPSVSGTVLLKVSNFGSKSRLLTLRPECTVPGALRERDLARSFAFYSLEDVSTRRFTMPFSAQANSGRSLLSYTTFSVDPSSSASLRELLITLFSEKGLTYQSKGGELVVRASYSLQPNSSYASYVQGETSEERPFYTPQGVSVKRFPFAPLGTPESVGKRLFTLSIECRDVKDGVEVWSGSARERLDEAVSEVDYARWFMPMMLTNFPFIRYTKNPVFLFHRLSYLYTGLHYSSDDLRLVAGVDPSSPAYEAGLRTGDLVESINGLRTVASSDRLTQAYRRFITQSYKFRDKETQFTDDTGFKKCAYWDPFKNLEVAKLFQKKSTMAPFSYLFCDRPYVSSPTIDRIVFEVLRDGQRLSFIVPAQRRDESFLELK